MAVPVYWPVARAIYTKILLDQNINTKAVSSSDNIQLYLNNTRADDSYFFLYFGSIKFN